MPAAMPSHQDPELPSLRPIARVQEANDIGHRMGQCRSLPIIHPGLRLRHRSLPVQGVQFHPESIATEHGHVMLKNFLAQASA